MAARPVPCGLFPGLIPGSQNADWPPATGDCADAAHCVPDTELNESTVIAGGGADPVGHKQDATGGRLTAPTISLPKGGGAIRGIGEKFTASLVTGTGS